MQSFIILGHGTEQLKGERPVIPPRCILVLTEECGMLGVIPWTLYPVISNLANKALFDDPVSHKAAIETLLKRPIRIYTEGQTYPRLTYTLLAYEKDYKNVGPSGVFAIPTPSFEYQPEKKGEKLYLLPAASVARAFEGAVIPAAAPPTQSLQKMERVASLRKTQEALFTERPGIYYSLLCRALSEEERIEELLDMTFPDADIFTVEGTDTFQAAAHWLASLDRSRLKKHQRSAIAEIESILATVMGRRKASGSPIGDTALESLISLLALRPHPSHEQLEAALDAGTDINKGDRRNGYTPLMMAAIQGHEEAVAELLKRGADVNARDLEGSTPLMFACTGGSLAICEALLAAGADPTAVSADDTNILHIACTKAALTPLIPRFLTSVDPKIPDMDGDTPLHLAAGWGLIDTVRLLLGAGADPNQPNKKGEIALMSAVEDGEAEIVDLLIPLTDIKTRTKTGNTALGLAIKAKQDSIAVALVEAGVPVASWAKILELAKETGMTQLATLAKRRLSSSERRRRTFKSGKKLSVGKSASHRKTSSRHG